MNKEQVIKEYREASEKLVANAEALLASVIAPSEPAGPSPVVGSGGVVGLRAAPAKVSCSRCEGTGFVWEGVGDCGPPNFCPTCGGDRIIEQRKPEPNNPVTHDGAQPRSCV